MKTIRLLFPFFCIAASLVIAYFELKTAFTFLPDFSIFFKSAQDISHHILPYTDKKLFTAFNYPLATSVFFFPFLMVSYTAAQIVFTFCSLAAAVSTVYLSYKLNRRTISYSFFAVVLLTLFAFPTKFTIGMGQVNLVAIAVLLSGFYFLQMKKVFAAILLFLIAVLLKPILSITLVILLIEKQRKLFFITIGTIALTVLLFPVIFHMPQGNKFFLTELLKQNLGGREVYYNQGFTGFFSRLTQNLQMRFFLSCIGSLICVVLAYIKLKRKKVVEKLAIALTLLVLIDPLSWQHHFVFLILPFCTVWFALQKLKSNKIFFLLLFILSYALVAWNFKNPNAFSIFPLSLLLSNQFYGALILFGIELKLL